VHLSFLRNKAEILAAYHERMSLRGIARVFSVSRNTISAWLKKSPDASSLGSDAAQGQEA